MKLKRLPTNIRPMPLQVSPKEFVEEWERCFLKPSRDKTYLFEMLDPFFEHWTQLLSTPSYSKDVQYMSLARLLQSEFKDPTEAFRLYVDWCNFNVSVKEDLMFLFLKRLAFFNFISPEMAPQRKEYIIARDFKLYLRNRIRDIASAEVRKIKCYEELEVSGQLAVYDSHPDYLFLRNLDLDPWRAILLHYHLSGYGNVQIENLIHMPRPAIYYEGREAWRELRKNSQMIQISPISKPL